MPELPEVETMVRGIRPTMEGATIAQFVACPCERKPLSVNPGLQEIQNRLSGESVSAVERLAKRVLFKLSSGDTLVFEPRMTGLVLISDPPSDAHLRFEFRLVRKRKKNSVWIWDRRGLGTLRLLTPEEFDIALGPNLLGPDALVISLPELTERLKRTSREIKVALLDQKLLAGVGNLYASEILHEAKVHPQKVAAKLTKPQVKRIHSAMNRILLEAIEYEGSTLNDGTYRNALNKDGSYQNKHRVYSKGNELCVTCNKSNVTRIVQAQRSTFYCPQCQKR